MPGRGGLTEARLQDGAGARGRRADRESGCRARPASAIGNIFILAGVPHIAGLMLEALAGQLEGGRPLLSATIGCWAPESEVADVLGETERAHPGCQIGSYPFFREGRVGANFVIRSTEAAAAGGLPRRSRRAARGGRADDRPRGRLDGWNKGAGSGRLTPIIDPGPCSWTVFSPGLPAASPPSPGSRWRSSPPSR